MNLIMKNAKKRASKFGRFKHKRKQNLNQGRDKYNNTENGGFGPPPLSKVMFYFQGKNLYLTIIKF